MRKGVIFDVDGTLLDSMSIWEDAGARYLKSLGAEPEENLGKILYPMTIEEAATSGNREHIEAAFQRLGIGGYFQKIWCGIKKVDSLFSRIS